MQNVMLNFRCTNIVNYTMSLSRMLVRIAARLRYEESANLIETACSPARYSFLMLNVLEELLINTSAQGQITK